MTIINLNCHLSLLTTLPSLLSESVLLGLRPYISTEYRISLSQDTTVVQQKPVISDITLGSKTILIWSDHIIVAAVTCVCVITQGTRKMIAEAQWINGHAVVKCWLPGYYERFFFHGIFFRVYTNALAATPMREISQHSST